MRRLLYVVDGVVVYGTRILGAEAESLDADTVELTLKRAQGGAVVFLKDAVVNGVHAKVVGFPFDLISVQGLPEGAVYGDEDHGISPLDS